MKVELDEGKLKEGVLGLVLALVEIIRDTLGLEAVRRMEGGRLSDAETERPGNALRELDEAIEQIKEDHGVGNAVQSVRDGLDDLVNDTLGALLEPRESRTSETIPTPPERMPGKPGGRAISPNGSGGTTRPMEQ
ncbi:MAG: gas vesicle protein K [Sphingomonadales bacterium]